MMFWPRYCEKYEKFPANFFLQQLLVMTRNLLLLTIDLRHSHRCDVVSGLAAGAMQSKPFTRATSKQHCSPKKLQQEVSY